MGGGSGMSSIGGGGGGIGGGGMSGGGGGGGCFVRGRKRSCRGSCFCLMSSEMTLGPAGGGGGGGGGGTACFCMRDRQQNETPNIHIKYSCFIPSFSCICSSEPCPEYSDLVRHRCFVSEFGQSFLFGVGLLYKWFSSSERRTKTVNH